jgi:hypothetical protein
LDIHHLEAMAPEAACERTVKIDYPVGSRSGLLLSGSTETKAADLIQFLRKKGLLP